MTPHELMLKTVADIAARKLQRKQKADKEAYDYDMNNRAKIINSKFRRSR